MENNVMFIGNLITDQHKPQLAESIFNLFKHCLNFEYIKKKDIEVKGKSKKCKFAFITLRSEDDYNEAYYKLGSFESRKQLGFNFLKLVDPSKQLIVDRKRPPKIVKNSPPKSKNSQPVASVEERKNSPPKSKNSQPVASVEERKNNLQNIMNYQPVITGEEKKNSPSNIKNTQPVVCVDERKNIPLKIRNQQSAVSVDLQAGEQYNDSVKQKQKFYREGELLGNETRNTEFKEGSGEHFIKKNLKDIVSRYMSGFLNSSQQGTLFIGVKDDG
jgi:Rad3-related DNA helicase